MKCSDTPSIPVDIRAKLAGMGWSVESVELENVLAELVGEERVCRVAARLDETRQRFVLAHAAGCIRQEASTRQIQAAHCQLTTLARLRQLGIVR